MLRVNKVSEYGILALSFMGLKQKAMSAREISEGLQLPYEITAKTLQRLKDAGFVGSTKGINGGYSLKVGLTEISFAQVIDAIEGKFAVADCLSDEHKGCARNNCCEMKRGMERLNTKVRALFESTMLDELLDNQVNERVVQ